MDSRGTQALAEAGSGGKHDAGIGPARCPALRRPDRDLRNRGQCWHGPGAHRPLQGRTEAGEFATSAANETAAEPAANATNTTGAEQAGHATETEQVVSTEAAAPDAAAQVAAQGASQQTSQQTSQQETTTG